MFCANCTEEEPAPYNYYLCRFPIEGRPTVLAHGRLCVDCGVRFAEAVTEAMKPFHVSLPGPTIHARSGPPSCGFCMSPLSGRVAARYGVALSFHRGFLRWEAVYGKPNVCRDCMGAVISALRASCAGAVSSIPTAEVALLGERHLSLTQALSLKGAALGVIPS